jgi:hypothetical protein
MFSPRDGNLHGAAQSPFADGPHLIFLLGHHLLSRTVNSVKYVHISVKKTRLCRCKGHRAHVRHCYMLHKKRLKDAGTVRVFCLYDTGHCVIHVFIQQFKNKGSILEATSRNNRTVCDNIA